MTIRVAVLGAGGRMGSTVCRAVHADADLELVAAVDPHHAGIDLGQLGLHGTGLAVAPSLHAIDGPAPDVAVDFTVVDASRENLAWCLDQGVHAVVGTTGFSADELDVLAARFATSDAHAVIAPNFAIGAVLMMRFAEIAAPYFDTAEIVEMHHDRKADAPSGTAMATARRMAAASSAWVPDPTEAVVLDGARGGAVGGIHVHALRSRGAVAHQEVVLGTDGQRLTIRHDSLDRESFMPGVLMAVKWVIDHPGLTLGLEQVLEL